MSPSQALMQFHRHKAALFSQALIGEDSLPIFWNPHYLMQSHMARQQKALLHVKDSFDLICKHSPIDR